MSWCVVSLRLFLLLLASVAWVAGLSATPLALAQAGRENSGPPAGNAVLEVPERLAPGETFLVTVREFSPGTEVSLFLMGPGPVARLLPPLSGSDRTDENGYAAWWTALPGNLSVTQSAGWWVSADDTQGRFGNRTISPVGAGTPLPAPTPRATPSVTAAAGTRVPVGTAMPTPIARGTVVPAATATASGRVSSTPRAMAGLPPNTWVVVLDQPRAPEPAAMTFLTSVDLRLRAGASFEREAIGLVPSQTQLRILAGPFETSIGNYYHVLLAGGEMGYVAPDPEDLGGEPALDPGGAYRLRTAPSDEAPAAALVPVGSRAFVLETSSTAPEWTRIRIERGSAGTFEGYVPTRVLQVEGPRLER